MSKLVINGNNRLNGIVDIGGSKNSALPILASTIMCKGNSIIHNCPQLSDVKATLKILNYLGAKTNRENDTVSINSDTINVSYIPETLMHEMRSSIIFLGALLSKFKKVRLSFPGGCEIGIRPIDLHLKALRQMGVKIKEEHGYLECEVDGKLKGARISLSFPSVGATENIMLAAVFADDETIITNAAREPEIEDLANFLNKCGAKIKILDDGNIVICPVEELNGCEYTVIPDRIVAITYLCAAAITNGNVTIQKANSKHIRSVLDILSESGCELFVEYDKIRVKSPERLKASPLIRTMPYPGFPTDAQAPVMAVMAKACGTSVFVENIFENRYQHISELNRLGADITTEMRTAVVRGVKNLYGAKVKASDLRAAAALIVAGLGAIGTTEVQGLKYLDRGYENIDTNLKKLGADVVRIDE